MATATFLRAVPVLAGLSDDLLEDLADQMNEVRARAGDWIMHKGDPADAMFIIRSGRVEVVDEGPPEALIGVLRRGDVLGELALLREGVRSGSVRALRDTELLELGRREFEQLIVDAPSFALGLTRVMGARLAASRPAVLVAAPPRTIAVIGLHRSPLLDEVVDELGRSFAVHGTVARLRGGDLATIEQAERDVDRTLLVGDLAAQDSWTDLCLTEADLVVVVSDGTADRSLTGRETADRSLTGRETALRGCELIVFGRRVHPSVLAALVPREVQVVGDSARRPLALAATARRLAGRSPGVVMSGGGARAFAHLGVLDELRAAGIKFDRVGGVSLGALVAGFVAMDVDPDTVYEIFQRGFVDTNPTNDYAIPAFALVRGGKTRRLLRQGFFDRRIEELPLRFFCLSCDLIAREAVVHRTGPIADAVYSSLAIPGVFPPVATLDGRLLVDGGVLDNLPVETMARAGEGPVLALDVTGRAGQVARRRRPGLEALGRPLRRALTGSDAEIPQLGETIVRTVLVGSTDTTAAARMHADAVITPQVEGIGMMDWGALTQVRELGRRAAREALERDPGLPGRLMQ